MKPTLIRKVPLSGGLANYYPEEEEEKFDEEEEDYSNWNIHPVVGDSNLGKTVNLIYIGTKAHARKAFEV